MIYRQYLWCIGLYKVWVYIHIHTSYIHCQHTPYKYTTIQPILIHMSYTIDAIYRRTDSIHIQLQVRVQCHPAAEHGRFGRVDEK